MSPAANYRWIIDENLIAVARAVTAVRNDVTYIGDDQPLVSVSTDDVLWLPVAAEHDLIAITSDLKLRRRPAERQAIIDHAARVVCITAKNATRWETLRLILRYWDDIEALQGERGPFVYRLNKSGLHPTAIW